MAKVTGAKLYASDFRAADLPGWPANTSHAMLVRAPDATHVYTGMDLALLGGALKPSVIVTAADLERIGTRVPEFYAGDLFCPVGKTPLYLGQPVGAADLRDLRCLRPGAARVEGRNFVKFGEETGPVAMPAYGAYRFTRVAGPTPEAPDVYSPLQEGWVSPGKFQNIAASDLAAAADRGRGALRQGRDLWRGDPRATGARTIRRCWCSTANSRPNRSTRCSSNRNAGLAWYDGTAEASNWCLACSRPTRPRSRSRICLATPARPSSRRASTPSSPMSAAASAAAITHRSCSTRAGGDVLSRPSGPAGA